MVAVVAEAVGGRRREYCRIARGPSRRTHRARERPSRSGTGSRRRDRSVRRDPAPPDQHFLGGRDRRRSGDLALFRRALCQLSYPTSKLSGPDGI